MVRTQNKQDATLMLKMSERVTLAVCVFVIGVAFALMGVFFTLSWLFFLLVVADLAVLVIGRMPDIAKRLTVLVSVVGAVLALAFAIASHPWLFR